MPSGEWVEVSPASRPPPRSYGALMFDATSDDVILFGGLGVGPVRLSDTYAWDGSNWVLLTPSTVPTARDGHVGTESNGVPHFFGGETGAGLEDDLYSWDGSNWNLEFPFNFVFPPARKYAGLAGDGSGGIWMWGGDTGGAFDNKMWQFLPFFGWVSYIPVGPIPPRIKHAMYYDPQRNSIVVHGGEDPTTGEPLDDTWEWKFAGYDFFPIVTTDTPPARTPSQGLKHDPILRRAVLVPARRAEGTITAIDSVYFSDGETFILNDGANPAQGFEFDDDSSVAGSNVAVDITGGVDANTMRDRIITAINGAGLNLKAHIGSGVGVVQLYSTAADDRANLTISETVGNLNFKVTGMAGAVGDTWTFNGGGAQWTEQTPSFQPPELEGVMAVYDGQAGQGVVMMFGGLEGGVEQQRHYKWVWASLGVSPYFSLPGALQGRIQPTAVQATDGSWVMQLGMDAEELPDFYLDIGDEVTVEQQLSLAGRKLIRFDIRARYSPRLPKFKQLVSNGSVDFYTPVKGVTAPDGITLIPASPPTTNIEFDVPTSLWNTTLEGDPGLIKFTMIYLPTGETREAFGVASSNPARVRAGDLMGQSDPPSTTLGDYALTIADSGLVRKVTNLNSGGDRLTGISIVGQQPLLEEHGDQLIAISGASDPPNNSPLGLPFRISDVPSEQGDVGAFGDLPSGGTPAGRVAIVENGSMVARTGDTAVSAAVYGAQWRVSVFVDIGGGDILRGELVENLVQADPDGWQRLHMAAHVSKITALTTLKFVLRLESVTG